MELPGAESQGGKYVGKLVRSFYGTRDAPLAWLTGVKQEMRDMGFTECKVTKLSGSHVKCSFEPTSSDITASHL